MTRSDRKRIDDALARAQAGTTGQVALRIIPDDRVDAMARAKAEFTSNDLHHHGAANAALILVAPTARRFAVIGDVALHERVGQDFWDETIAQMAATFATGTPTDAIVQGIDRLGTAFHEHFKA